MRPRWRNALAVAVNPFTDIAQIRHCVMAITPDACEVFATPIMRMEVAMTPRRHAEMRMPRGVRPRAELVLQDRSLTSRKLSHTGDIC
jgi:hypothetical protein